MPRRGKGGGPAPALEGSPGRQYGGAPRPSVPGSAPIPPTPGRPTQPVRTATGQGYGDAGRDAQAQRTVPLPATGPAIPAGSAPAVPQRQPPDRLASAIEAAKGMPFDAVPINAPTQRPGEPVTSGVGVGPGPGPESLGFNTNSRVASTLQAIATATGDQDLVSLAEFASSQKA